MGISSRVVSGASVVLAGLWFLAIPSMVACEDMQTGEVLSGCVEVVTPLVTYFCATPPLVLAVLLHTMRYGEQSAVNFLPIPNDEEGRAVLSADAPATKEQMPPVAYAKWGMVIGGVSMAGAYAITFVVGVFAAVPLLIMAALSFGSTGDPNVDWLVNIFDVSFLVMRIGFWLFAASAITTFVLERNDTGPSGGRKPKKIVAPCPSCGSKLKFPSNYSGQIQCPSCEHVFVVSEG